MVYDLPRQLGLKRVPDRSKLDAYYITRQEDNLPQILALLSAHRPQWDWRLVQRSEGYHSSGGKAAMDGNTAELYVQTQAGELEVKVGHSLVFSSDSLAVLSESIMSVLFLEFDENPQHMTPYGDRFKF